MIKRVGLSPFRRLGGAARPQLEIAGVEKRAVVGLEKELGRAEDVARGQKHQVETADRRRLAEGHHVLVALSRQARLHQPRRSFRDDDLLMRRDVIAVGMRDKRERLRVPRIEPEIFAAADKRRARIELRSREIYARNDARETGIRVRAASAVVALTARGTVPFP